MKKFLHKIMRHKFISGLIILAVLVGGYYGYKIFFGPVPQTSYVTVAAEKGTIISSVGGSGQVSVLNQLDVKPKVSGDIIYVAVANGQEVKVGALLAQIDFTDAAKSVRDAQTSLETAQLDLDQLLEPVDRLILLQAEDSLTQAQQSKETAEYNLQKSYEDGFNTVSNAFLNLPTVMSGLQDILFSSDKTLSGGSQWNIDFYASAVQIYDSRAAQYRDDAYDVYAKARASYDLNFADYKATSRFADTATIEKLIGETYDSTKDIAEAVKSAINLIQF